MNSMADVTFPSVPQVASLLIYDDTSKAKDRTSPIAGYPVICITVSISAQKQNKTSVWILFSGFWAPSINPYGDESHILVTHISSS